MKVKTTYPKIMTTLASKKNTVSWKLVNDSAKCTFKLSMYVARS